MAFTGDNSKLLDSLYDMYLRQPDQLSEQWRDFFQDFDNDQDLVAMLADRPQQHTIETKQELDCLAIQGVCDLYRKHGHRAASLDPLGMLSMDRSHIKSQLALLSDQEKKLPVDSGNPSLGVVTMQELIDHLERTYCSTIGSDFFYLVNDQERDWLQGKIEDANFLRPLSESIRQRIFEKIFQADFFEKFLAKKYVGKKRFSLEGADSLIVLLDAAIEQAVDYQVQGMVIGMSHRGRLNVLGNIMRKASSALFAEFEERYDPNARNYSDVKYHLGYLNSVTSQSGKQISLSLAFNPSHLEAVDPVVIGQVRALQEKQGQGRFDSFVPLLIHGDAAFVGQGVVAETLNLMSLPGYCVGGSIHVVVNNQIGFTTFPHDSRSTMYATDLAKGFQIPIFHVNADDPEAVYRILGLAFAYRMRFSKDVIIDLIAYRRHGHNEMDEASFTQPLMVEAIKKHLAPWQVYESFLQSEANFDSSKISQAKAFVRQSLEESFQQARNVVMFAQTLENPKQDSSTGDPMAVSKTHLAAICQALTTVPDHVRPSAKIARLLGHRQEMSQGKSMLNWGFAESLAFGCLLLEGYDVRLSGQDCQRGTFSQRHLAIVDIRNNDLYFSLNHIQAKQGRLTAINSSLSEFAVLGFEYGYASVQNQTLTIWEAQFGDFVNSAQVIIDQFISSGEKKWLRSNGLVLLLPHGYEGQGPEHSSARIERFLQLCAEDNMRICNCSTPAQYFHLLRRQAKKLPHKPLVVFTPKSLLRHPQAGSSINDLLSGFFQSLLDDDKFKSGETSPSQVRRLVFCSGKVFYDLVNEREAKEIKDIAILRLEEIYPFPELKIKTALAAYGNAREFVWCQEEPANQGCYGFIKDPLAAVVGGKIYYAGRPASASPATGLTKIHVAEQQLLINEALGGFA